MSTYTKALLAMLFLQSPLQIYCQSSPGITQFTDSGDSSQISVATDNHNNAVAVYKDSGLIYGVYSPQGGLWTPAQQISDNIPDKKIPIVAMDLSSTALAVWIATNVLDTVETSFFSNGIWSTPTPAPLDSTPGIFGEIVLSMNGSGKGLAAWNTDSNEAHASFFSNGTWSPVDVIATAIVAESGIACAYSANGTAVVLFSHLDVSTLGAVSYDGTSWQPPVIIDTFADSGPSVGIDANGHAIGMWVSGPNSDIVSSRYDPATSSWSAPQIISINGGNGDPIIAVAQDGSAVAIWVDGSNNIIMNRFNGTSWGVATIIVSDSVSPNVTLDISGNALITWVTGDTQLYSALLPNGGVLEAPNLIVSSDSGLSVPVPRAALSGDANTSWYVWNEGDGEEPSNTFGTSFILAPTPAISISGTVNTLEFVTQAERINVITWVPSTDPTVVSYLLTRNGILIDTIPATGPFTYSDHNRCNKSYTYSITAVNADGVESTPVSVTLFG